MPPSIRATTGRLALLAWLAALVLLPPAGAAEPSAAPAVLVDADWLAARLDDPGVRLVELGPTREQFDAGHLPGAVHVDWVNEIIDPDKPQRYTKVGKDRFEELMGGLGVAADTTVVFSDTTDNRLSVRMLWMLRYYGHRDARVLDGGRKAWLRSGRELTTAKTTPAPKEYVVRAELEKLCIDRRFIEQRLAGGRMVLIDGRPAGQFTGEQPGKVYHTGKPHARRGHIPGAVNVPWKANLNPDGTFKPPAELRRLYASVGASRDKLAVTYCNEGLHAAMPWFVLTELLGHPDARLYDDSMAEWANTDETPVAVSEDR